MYSSSSANSVTAWVMRSESPTASSNVNDARGAQQVAQDREPALERHRDPRHVAGVDRRRHAQQAADRVGEPLGLVCLAGRLDRHAAQLRRQRRGPVAVRLLGRASRSCIHSDAGAELAVLEQPREQLLRGLVRVEVEPLVLLGGQHQPRLQLQQRGDQDQELGRRLQVQLAPRLEPLDVGEHDLGEVDLEQVDVLVQDQRDEQVERPLEHIQVEGRATAARRRLRS